jgi:hypothetical protein
MFGIRNAAPGEKLRVRSPGRVRATCAVCISMRARAGDQAQMAARKGVHALGTLRARRGWMWAKANTQADDVNAPRPARPAGALTARLPRARPGPPTGLFGHLLFACQHRYIVIPT